MTGRDPITFVEAMHAPELFGGAFAPLAPWHAWLVFAQAVFAEPMAEEARKIFHACTGRQTPPQKAVGLALALVGRRGGKSRFAAALAVYLACFRNYRSVLALGERGTVMLIAADRRQARVMLRYIQALLQLPALRGLVAVSQREAISLRNGLTIEVHTASFRTVRGYTVVAAICDEVCFWRDETSANPDAEILQALRPAMATVPGALLLLISSPHARRGAAWKIHRGHYGREGDPILVWQAATATMNPTLDPAVIEAAYQEDPIVAAAEYGAEFRRDVEAFVDEEALQAVVVPGRRELEPRPDLVYWAFVDPAGGSGGDAKTMAIAHEENGHRVLDLVRERRPPFSPDQVVGDFSVDLKRYWIRSVTGDRFAGEWPAERFRAYDIEYIASDRTKSEIYRDLLPMINSGTVELLDHPRLLTQLRGLERSVRSNSPDRIDHGPNGHDDLINAAAGALTMPRPMGLEVYAV